MTDITAPLPLRARSTRKSAQNHRFGKVTTADDETTLTAIDKKQPPKPTNLYPGLNDITDAFEAFPTDLRKYFTLLKEIDAKCVQPLPELEHQIKRFQNVGNSASNIDQRNEIISAICNLLNEILPCLEEKMHVASIGADKALSFIDRINDDYDLIINKELPTSVIYGDTHHPAIMDIKVADNKSAQSQRSESRREALAARKAVSTETDNEDAGNVTSTNNNHSSTNNHTTTSTGKSSKARKGGPDKEGTPVPGQTSQGGNSGNTSNTGSSNKKRKPNNSNKDKDSTTTGQSTSSKSEDPASIPRPGTPSSANKRRAGQKKKTANATAQATSTDSTTSSSQQHQHQHEHHQQQQQQNSTEKASTITPEPQEEPTYCYCDQVSYGEMVGCDGEYCQREWFHLPCIGLTTLPRGKWYCDDCKALEADKKKASKK